jgi:hypothetical protein
MPTIPTTMRAAAIDEFGGPEVAFLRRALCLCVALVAADLIIQWQLDSVAA